MRSRFAEALLACMLVTATATGVAATPPRTVCTITVNSIDEADAFRSALPPQQYRFVELVERGRSDWLASACRRGVQCDVLVISGHYDGEGMFFSDDVGRSEHLPVNELERVACSDSCPGLFDRLREVYLFGCHTLSGEAVKRSWHDGLRERDGGSLASATRHGESSRDRMARIFRNVPVLYGFAAVAPLGPVSAGVLARYLKAGGSAEVGGGRPSARLLAHFSAHALTATHGIRDGDPRMAHLRDVCRFEDERLSTVQKAAFVHALLQRPSAEIATLLGRLEDFGERMEVASRDPATARAFSAITEDATTRERFLAAARATGDAALRARLIALARQLGWLSESGQREEWVRLLHDRIERDPTASDVDLACRLGRDGALAAGMDSLRSTQGDASARDAMLACAGDEEARERVLDALPEVGSEGAELARVLLRHRPARDAAEFRRLAANIARMDSADAQARTLHSLAREPFADNVTADVLGRWFASTTSLAVQRAIAGVLLRSDLRALERANVASMLREHRLRSSDGRDAIDVLIDRLAKLQARAEP